MPEKLRTAAVLALRFLFLTRYSWMLALTLVGLPPLALVVAPALLENLFVLDRPGHVFQVSWITIFCSASVIATLHITTLNAIDRFDDYRAACEDFHAAWGSVYRSGQPWYRRRDAWMMLALGGCAATCMWYVVMSACVSRTANDPHPAWSTVVGAELTPRAVTIAAWREALRGYGYTGASLIGVYCAVLLHRWLFSPIPIKAQCYQYSLLSADEADPGDPPVRGQPIFAFLAWVFGPGYFREIIYEKKGERRKQIILAPGHAGLIICTTLFLLWYGWNYVDGLRSGIVLIDSSPFPALFFGMLSLQLVVLLLPGIAFLLDRHRIPIMPTLMLMMCLFYSIFGTDHFYELNPEPRIETEYEAPTFEQLLDGRKLPLDAEGKRTLVVVDASGGGIQASAWSAQVLTGLHELYGEPFSRSIGLISAVSGGSVGTMFYLANRADLSETFEKERRETVLPPSAIARIRTASRASGLEATCWGIAYPDTLRAVFPPLAHRSIDRGWSVEENWRERMRLTDPELADLRLSQLGERLQKSTLPVPVFNATLVETGQRLLISPVLSPTNQNNDPSGGVEFLKCFPESHLRISTAARLSATFPYVTPVSRPYVPPEHRVIGPEHPLMNLHVADGAYVDNEGAVTSVDWINRLLVYYSHPENVERRPFDRVLLIRIQAFRKESSKIIQPASSFAGWRAALLGPFDAMMHVRSTSQTERGDLEISLLTRATRAELDAAKERTASGFKSELTRVQELESMHHELRELSMAASTGQADIDRKVLETDDELRAARERLGKFQRQQRRLEELKVESVVFDFQNDEEVRVPMSWKLTSRQQKQIDHVWELLVSGSYSGQPLETLDKYFPRVKRPVANVAADF